MQGRAVSLLPIDVGFDVRATGHTVAVDDDVRSVEYEDLDGNPQTVSGSTSRIRGTLTDAGYLLI